MFKFVFILLCIFLIIGCALISRDEIGNLSECSSEDLVALYERTSEDSIKLEKIKLEISTRFPASEQTYDFANEEFYDKIYPIWRDDSLKVEVISELIEKYQQSNWRRTMYQYLTYSLNELEMTDELILVLEDFRNAFPNDYKSFSQSARYLSKNDINLEQALEFAQEAHQMSFDYPKMDFYPVMQWELEERSAPVNTAAILADILIKLEKYDEAEEVLKNIIADNQLGIDDETTLGSCYYYLAKVYDSLMQKEKAVDAALQSLIAGDSRNKYTPQADSLLRKIIAYKDLSEDEYIDFMRYRSKYDDVIFTDITEEFGLENIRAGRVAWGDFDNDGSQDLLLDGCRLFKNQNGKSFIEITQTAFPDTIRANGGLWGDFDNDGDLDIITKDPESVWLNNGEIFRKIYNKKSLEDNGISTEGVGIGDVNNDGWLDVYFANYEVWKVTDSEPEADQFFIGKGNGKFKKFTKKAGVLPEDKEKRAGRGVNFGDFDNDGDLDIFVSNYRLQENFLWVNDGNGKFQNKARELGVSGVEVEGWWGHTIGSGWADVDNDGDLDLITANLAHPRYIDFSNTTKLYLNSGAPDWKFTDVRRNSGIRFEETHSEPAWGDLNNDGFLDLYINCIYEGRRSFLYMNNQDETFREVTFLAGVRHFNGWGVAFADFDNDGDLDILAAGGTIQLFRNDTPNTGNWLEVEVKSKNHSDGIGARLTLSNDKISLIREIQGGKGTTNQHALVQHFGLGEYEPPFNLEIRFPSKVERIIRIDEINKMIIIDEKKEKK
ncbi:MAG: VCBS repeat-containing protein [Armatimonadetes bacterium]|nr:VCBS repeat-containing protein [Armatimonadota bacterium]